MPDNQKGSTGILDPESKREGKGQEIALPKLDSTKLAWLAETSDGTRDEEFLLVLDANRELQVRKKQESGDEAVAKVLTTSKQAGRRKVVSVSLQIEDAKDVQLYSSEGCDAVFWTESAVEKFLYPYYHSQRLWDSRMDAVKQEFESNPNVVAIGHRAPSNSLTITPTTESTLQVAKLQEDGKSCSWMSVDALLAARKR